MLFVVAFVLSIHLSLLVDRHYTLSVNTLHGKMKIHMLQFINIKQKYI